jgi:hypothetical protein
MVPTHRVWSAPTATFWLTLTKPQALASVQPVKVCREKVDVTPDAGTNVWISSVPGGYTSSQPPTLQVRKTSKRVDACISPATPTVCSVISSVNVDKLVTHTSISTSSPARIPFGLHGVKSEQMVGAALREAVQTHGVATEQACALTPSRAASSSAGTRLPLPLRARGRLHARGAAEPADGMVASTASLRRFG